MILGCRAAEATRVVFDSLSEVRLLAGTALRYRRQILALKRYLPGGCTVLMLDDLTATDRDLQVHSIAHGVISLEQLNPDYGAERRRLRVRSFAAGRSGAVITTTSFVKAESMSFRVWWRQSTGGE